METGKTFVQVFIKSESDLPKEDGYYFVKFKQKDDPKIYADTFASHYFGEGDMRDAIWNDCIDWYLKPISSNRERVIEVLKKYERSIDDSDYHDVAIFSCDYERIASDLEGISEVKESSQSNVTDEEIESEATNLYNSHKALEDESPITYSFESLCLHETQGFRAGAKWLRSRLQQPTKDSISDEQIEKYVNGKFLFDPNDFDSDEIVQQRRFGATIAIREMQSGKISEWIKNQK